MILHPGVAVALRRLIGNELDLARLMAAGELPSPQPYENITLFAVRVTGTGLAYRQGLKEHVFRDPAEYLNSEFLARCNGLPVIWEHPPKPVLDGDEFAARVIGTVFLPYINGDEVWSIVKVFDPQAARLMENGELSTSPCVVFRDESVNHRLSSEDGRSLLLEGKPSLLDHLAVCDRGVWDKGGIPAGVRSDSVKEKTMADETEDKGGASDGDKLDALLEHLTNISGSMKDLTSRMDAMEAKGKADATKKDEGDEKGAEIPSERPTERKDSMATRRADDAALASTQAKADSAFNMHGKRAPMPMVGETPLRYRVRMVRELQRFSPAHEGINLDAIAHADEAGFSTIEGRIYADSEKEAARPTMFADDTIRMRERRNPDTGGPIREFHGPSTFVREMSPPPRPVMSINRDPAALAH